MRSLSLPRKLDLFDLVIYTIIFLMNFFVGIKVLEALINIAFSDQESIIIKTYQEIPPVWIDPKSTLIKQVALLETICTLINNLPDSTIMDSIINHNDTHFYTDLDLNMKIYKDTFDHQEIHPLVCEFPTINIDTP